MLSKVNYRFDSNTKSGQITRPRGTHDSMDYSEDTIAYSSIPFDKGAATRVSLTHNQINSYLIYRLQLLQCTRR